MALDAQGMWYCCSFREDSGDGKGDVITDVFLYIYEDQLTQFENFIRVVSYDNTPALTWEGEEEEKSIIFRKSKTTETMLPGHSTTLTSRAPHPNTSTKKWFWLSIHQHARDEYDEYQVEEPFFQWWSL